MPEPTAPPTPAPPTPPATPPRPHLRAAARHVATHPLTPLVGLVAVWLTGSLTLPPHTTPVWDAIGLVTIAWAALSGHGRACRADERDLAADDHADLLDGLADTLEAAARHTGPPDLTPGYRQGLLRAALHIRGAAATSRLPSVDEVAGSIPHITPHRAGLASLTPRPTRR